MKKKRIMLLAICIALVTAILVSTTVSVFLTPKKLASLINYENIQKITMQDLVGNFNEETNSQEPISFVLDENEISDFANKVKDGSYKSRIGNIKAKSQFSCEIIYLDGTKIFFDSYQISKYNDRNELIFSKKIYLLSNFEEFAKS